VHFESITSLTSRVSGMHPAMNKEKASKGMAIMKYIRKG